MYAVPTEPAPIITIFLRLAYIREFGTAILIFRIVQLIGIGDHQATPISRLEAL